MLSIKVCDQSFGNCFDSGCDCLSAQAVASHDSDFTRLFHIISFLGKLSTHLENHRFVDALWRFLGSLTLSWVSLLSPHTHCHHCSLLSDSLARCCLMNAAGTTTITTLSSISNIPVLQNHLHFWEKNKKGKKNKKRSGFPMLG